MLRLIFEFLESIAVALEERDKRKMIAKLKGQSDNS